MLCICILAGCGSSDGTSAQDIADRLKGFSPDTVCWTELDRTKISTYFGFGDQNISGFKGYLNEAEDKFDMIAVFSFDDDGSREDILKGINSMSEQMSDTYRLANKSVADKINSKIVAETKGTVILCIMDKNNKVTEYLTKELNADIIS